MKKESLRIGMQEIKIKRTSVSVKETKRVRKNPPNKFHFSSFKAFPIVETSVQLLILFVLRVCVHFIV